MTSIYYNFNRVSNRLVSYRGYKSAAAFGLKSSEPAVRTNKHQTREALFNLNSRNRDDQTQKLPSFNKNYVQFTEPVKQFSTVDVVDGLMDSVKSIIGAKTLPTSIQSLSFMSLLNPKSHQTLLAAETGSGKTFAFLIPLIHSLKSSEGARNTHTTRKPRALIMAPTRELCRQLTSQVKALTHVTKLKSTYVHSAAEQADDITHDDVLIGSPDQLHKLGAQCDGLFAGVEWVVLDEADALFEKDFIASTEALLGEVQVSRGRDVQLVMSTATVNEKFSSYLDAQYPRINRLISPKTHTLPRALKLSYAPYHSGNKLADLRSAVQDAMYGGGVANRASNAKTLVFVNTNERAETVARYFSERGMDAVAMTSASVSRSKVSNRPIKQFLRGALGEGAGVLVTTSLLARGLDFGTHVQNVFIAEESGSTVDFLHRAGRTGRAGAQGHVTVMVPNKKYQQLSRSKR